MISLRIPKAVVTFATALALGLTSLTPLSAATLGRSISLIRDAEAEALVRDYVRPILKVAGLGNASIQVKIVDDPTFNAFVADSRHIFIHAGTLIETKTPNELIGVLAHETGHLAANHLAQLRQEIARMQILSVLAILGGAAAGALSGNGGAGTAAALGGLQIGQRGFLAYAREQESSADIAAVKFLDKTGQSAKGMLTTFERMADQQLFSSAGSNPYVFTHPLPADRLAQIEELARKSRNFDRTDDPGLQARHDLVRAKFVAFTSSAQSTMRAYPDSDTSLPARYARAILAYRFGNPAAAVAKVDELIKAAPSDPYFLELKGQILLESGKAAQAVDPLQKAVALAPDAGLIRVLLGQALVATGDPKRLDAAIAALSKGIGDDPDQAIGYRQLAIAYAKTGNTALADLATAQGAFAAGDIKSARQYALRAQGQLKTGSPAWLRADDIVTYKEMR